MKDVIIIPTYNERENIKLLIPEIFEVLPEINILIVDDNSPDKTAELVEEFKKEYKNLLLIKRTGKLGLGSAYLEAFKYLLEIPDIFSVITMDADFSHQPKYLPVLLDELKNYDLVIGSRYTRGGKAEWGILRRVLSRYANRYCRLITSLPISDFSSGFNCIKADFLRKLNFSNFISPNYAFLVELKYYLWKAGAKIKETPIFLKERTRGETKLSRRIIFEGILIPWGLIFKNYFKKLKNFLAAVKEAYKKRGILFVFKFGPKVVWRTFLKRNKKSFIFQNKKYNYFYRLYNCTCLNERAVEIPIVWEIAKSHRGKRILELGNVLSHYFRVSHDVLDKYEIADGVINQDIVNFKPARKYDLILSISTLEHIGFDEELKDPKKILSAIQNLKECLDPGGKIIFTAGLGYNPGFDNLLKESEIRFTKQYFLKRDENTNEWKEVARDEVQNIKYNFHQYTANGLVIGIIENI